MPLGYRGTNHKKCKRKGHPLTHVFGSTGPLTRTCECGDVTGETICAECGGPWSTADGHPQDCWMWKAHHGAPSGSPLAELDRIIMGEHEAT